MNTFLTRVSRVALMVILISTIHSQTAVPQTNLIIVPGNITMKRYNPNTPLEPQQVSNTTASSASNSRRNYLPSLLATWPSILTNLQKIGGNIIVMNPNGNPDLILPLEANRTFPTGATSNQLRAILAEVVLVLTHIREVRGPRLYNNTVLMSDIPPFLEAQFDLYMNGLDMALSEITRNKAQLDQLDQDMISDVEYIITKGSFEVDTHNATLINNNFYNQKLPLFSQVSANIEKQMADTRRLQTDVRLAIEKGAVDFRRRLQVRRDQIHQRTVEWTNDVNTIWNATDVFFTTSINTIRARKPAVRDSFDAIFSAHCNPSSDLLDAAIQHVNEWRIGEAEVAKYLKASTNNVTNAIIKELDSRVTIGVSGLKRGIDCINSIDTQHGVAIRAIATEFFTTEATKVDKILADGYTALNSIITNTNTVVFDQGAALRTLSTASTAPAKNLALGTFLEKAMNFLGEVAPVFLGRNEVMIQSIPLTPNNLFQVSRAGLFQYQPFLMNVPVQYNRRVVPTLLDEVNNAGLTNYSPEVGVVSVPTWDPMPANYAATDLANSGKQASVLLPMCYDNEIVQNNIMPLVPPHDYGVYSLPIPISHLNFVDIPSVMFEFSFPAVIPPVVFKKTPKELTFTIPNETDVGKSFNGAFNFVRSVSVHSTNMGVELVIIVSDNDQFESMLRMTNKPRIKLTIIPNEKPF